MSQDKIRQIISWITAVLIIIMAVALMVSCVSIYLSGDRPFSREIITVYAGKISIVGYLCLVCVLIGLLFPKIDPKIKPIRDEIVQLERYQTVLPPAKKERKMRKIYRWATAGLIVALSVWPIVYYCDISHFSVTDLSDDIIRAVLAALIPTVISLCLVFLCSLLEKRSISREIAIYKENGEKAGKAPAKKNMDPKVLLTIRTAVLAVSVIFIILGVCNEGIADVLGKAIRICTECIGLG